MVSRYGTFCLCDHADDFTFCSEKERADRIKKMFCGLASYKGYSIELTPNYLTLNRKRITRHKGDDEAIKNIEGLINVHPSD